MRARLALVAVLCLGAGCSKAPPPQRTDTAQPAPVDSTPTVQTAAAPTGSKIGTLPLTRDMPSPRDGGTCNVDASNIEKRITYNTGESPVRTIQVGVGDASRPFLATFVEVRGTQSFAGAQAGETIYAQFEADGRLRRGTREYVGATSESVALPAGDVEPLKQMAQQIMGWCK